MEGKRIWVFHVFGICIHVDLILIEIIILLKKKKKKRDNYYFGSVLDFNRFPSSPRMGAYGASISLAGSHGTLVQWLPPDSQWRLAWMVWSAN